MVCMEGVTSIGACYCHRQWKTTEIGEGEAHDYYVSHMPTNCSHFSNQGSYCGYTCRDQASCSNRELSLRRL